MAPLKFLPERSTPRTKERLCDKPLLDVIMDYMPPLNKEDEKRVTIKHVTNCHDTSLFRLVKRAKAKGRKNVTKKIIQICAVGWGMSKFLSIPEYSDLINTRQEKSLHCETEEEKLIYADTRTVDVFKDTINDKTSEVKISLSDADFEVISNIASTMRMTVSDVTLLFYYIGVTRGVDEMIFPVNERTPQWELDKMNKLVAYADEHLRVMDLDIEMYNRKLSIRGKTLI